MIRLHAKHSIYYLIAHSFLLLAEAQAKTLNLTRPVIEWDRIQRPMTSMEATSDTLLATLKSTLSETSIGPQQDLDRLNLDLKLSTWEEHPSLQELLHTNPLGKPAIDLRAINLRNINLEGRPLDGIDFLRSNLRGVSFKGANLNNVNFREAHLTDVDFSEAKLTNCSFSDSSIHNSHFNGTVIQNTDFTRATLTSCFAKGSIIDTAIMSQTLFDSVNLKDSTWNAVFAVDAGINKSNLDSLSLTNGQFTRVDFSNTKLGVAADRVHFLDCTFEKTVFRGIELGHQVFLESLISGDDQISSLSGAQNLHKLRFTKSEFALAKMRNGFKSLGMIREERALNYAINKERQRKLWINEEHGQWSFNIAVELLTAYGMYSLRPLKCMLAMTTLMALLYIPPIVCPNRRKSQQPYTPATSGIWVQKAEDLRESHGTEEPPKLISVYERFEGSIPQNWYFRNFFFLMLLLFQSVFYSLMLTFRIGWKDLGTNNWMTRLHPSGIVFNATGCYRTWSGFQSVLGFFFFTLWVWATFSLPLE